jgi:hypothetical protein
MNNSAFFSANCLGKLDSKEGDCPEHMIPDNGFINSRSYQMPRSCYPTFKPEHASVVSRLLESLSEQTPVIFLDGTSGFMNEKLKASGNFVIVNIGDGMLFYKEVEQLEQTPPN